MLRTAVRGALVAGVVTLAAMLLAPRETRAQDAYPSKPIRMIVNGAAGGVTDIPARLIAEHMREILGQTIVVESNGGGGGIVGAMQVKNAPADGYTLGYFHAASHGLLPALKKNMPYDALEDFIQVFQTVRAPFAFIVPTSRPYKTIAEMIAYAKTKPDGLSCGTPGIGNSSHLVCIIMAKQYGVIMKPVHYRGESLAAQDVVGGTLDWAMVSSAKGIVDGGTARAIATTGDKRWFVFPDVPTLREQGVPVDIYAFNGIMVPKGTPQPIVDKLNAAANEALQKPGVKEKLAAIGFETIGGTPALFRKSIVDYITFAKKLGEENNLSID
jgi:tripartite-type tricarboxylate transporter receptor subunit TctC